VKYLSVSLVLFVALFSAVGQATELDEILDSTVDFDIPAVTEPESKIKLDFAYQIGVEAGGKNELNSHKLESRFQWQDFLTQKIYASVDAKLLARLPKDQSLSKGKDAEADYRVRELSLQRNWQAFSLKAGMQPVIWGEMDTLTITDVMTPWDYSEFAFTSPEDARVAQGTIRLNYFSSQATMDLVYTPYPLANRFPGGSAESLLDLMLPGIEVQYDEDFPKVGDDYELGMRVKTTQGPSDYGLYVAHVMSDLPFFQLVSPPLTFPWQMELQYSSYDMLGISANRSMGNLLWKLELAYKDNMYLPGLEFIRRDVIEVGAGFDYNANGSYDLTLEILNQQIRSGEGQLVGMKPRNNQVNLRWSKNFLHQTLATVYYFSYQVQYGDRTHAASLQYKLNDDWRVDMVGTLFQIENTESPMQFIDDWDSVVLRINYTI